MKKKLIRRVSFENGTLYGTVEGRRLPLAGCDPVLELYEHTSTVPILGTGYKKKTWHVRLILCKNMEATREITREYLQRITQYDLTAEIQREDGIFQDIGFHNIRLTDIEEGTWTFETETIPEELKTILRL
jgi:hypothetical protein